MSQSCSKVSGNTLKRELQRAKNKPGMLLAPGLVSPLDVVAIQILVIIGCCDAISIGTPPKELALTFLRSFLFNGVVSVRRHSTKSLHP